MSKDESIKKILSASFEECEDSRVFSKAEIEAMLCQFREVLEKEHKDENSIYLENLLNNLPDKVYFKDTDSNFIKVNKYFSDSLGFDSPDDMLGKSDFDLGSYKLAIQKYADEQKIIQHKSVIHGKEEQEELLDGSTGWVSSTKSPLYSPTGEVVGTFGISRDITDRKVAEIHLQRIADELQKKNSQIEADMEMAKNVQMAFIPRSYPSFIWDLSSNRSGLDFFHRYIPCDTLAGDFFQVIPISNSQAGVIICDVMGHGIRASLVTAVLKGLVGELKLITPYPHVFLRKVNRSLCEVLKHLDSMVFVTAFYGVFDLIKGQLRYANAGHPLPMVLSRTDQLSKMLAPVSDVPEPALGLLEAFKYSSKTVPIQQGDSYFFYTDGITELESPEGKEFGYDRLLRLLNQPEIETSDPILEALFEQIRAFAGTQGFRDDMCAVSVDVNRIAEKA